MTDFERLREDTIEFAQVRQKAHEWLNGLSSSGVNDVSAIVAVLFVLVERVGAARGEQVAIDWLRAQADALETANVEMQGRQG